MHGFRRVAARRGLTDQDVETLYRLLLGRTPSPDEVARQRRATDDWQALLAAIVASPEYVERGAGRRAGIAPGDSSARVNIWHRDLAAWTTPPGTLSPDGDAVVGREGHIFLVGGTNSVLDQYQAGFALPADWAQAWERVLEVRTREAAELGVTLAAVVVPDKLSVLRALLPPGLELVGASPASLLFDRFALCYPTDRLTQTPGGVFLRTDTHFSQPGTDTLAAVVLAELGLGPVPAPAETVSYLASGDLGSRFAPPVVEVVTADVSWGDAVVVSDNRELLEARGKHVGTYRVLSNPKARDPRVAVVFGDSFGFPQEHYHGVAWHLAQVLREVHFVWVPFGWDAELVRRVGASLVVCETAERFVPRPPAERVDVARLLEAELWERERLR